MDRTVRKLLLAATLVAANAACAGGSPAGTDGATSDAARGEGLFTTNCASCHGVGAVGTTQGPMFLDAVYEPGHHGDEAFQRAAAVGVQPHHWDFGPMPPVGQLNGLTREDVADIIAYVRELQRAVGIG